jgi:hypothetical protein
MGIVLSKKYGGKIMCYLEIVRQYEHNPRNVHTVPTDGRTPRWFWVSVKGNQVYVSSGTTPYVNSNIRGQRLLKADELQDMILLYQRRKRGEPVSVDASRISQNQVYWYGIFYDLKL